LAGLLQRCVARCPSQQYSEAAAHAEHRGTNRSAGSATVTISATTGTVRTLAISSSVHQLQTPRSHTQDPQHVNLSHQPTTSDFENLHITSILQPYRCFTDFTLLTAHSDALLLPFGTLLTLTLYVLAF